MMMSAATVGTSVYPQLSTPVFASGTASAAPAASASASSASAASEKSTLVNMPEELSSGTINEYFLSPDGKKIYYISEMDHLNGCKTCLKSFDPSTGKLTTKAVFTVCPYTCVANGKIYSLYSVYGKDHRYELTVYNMKTDNTERHVNLPEEYGYTGIGNQALVLGVDSRENLIIASYACNTLFYTDKNGKTLSTVKYNDDISGFVGIDNATGNFFVKGRMEWVYWGYPYTMNVVRMGNVNGKKITFNNNYIDVESQLGTSTSYAQSEILGGRYLAVSSNFASFVALYDLKKLNVSQTLNYKL